LDNLDKLILREVCQGSVERLVWPDFRLSARAIGRKLGIPGGTVRDRLIKWSKSGFLKKPVLWLNPSLFDLHMGMLALDASPAIPKTEIVKRLKLVDDVAVIVTHADNYLGIAFYYADKESLEKKLGVISALCEARDSKFTETPYPQCSLKLAKTDWRVIASLSKDVTRPYSAIAKELNLSARTVKRRVTSLVGGSAITAVASTSVTALENELFADLVVEYNDRIDRADVDRTLLLTLEPYVFSAGPGVRYSLFVLNPPNVKSCTEVLERVRRINGVKSARLDLMEERVELYGALHAHVEKKLNINQVAVKVRSRAA
jgi:DNA-binding Lrp family transcriptional regulator